MNLLNKKLIYRSEIDGLRAFAILAVIINHFNKDILPNGYLGVDVFFVISGYVITLSLSKKQYKNFLEFISNFYSKRIRRILPPLLCFVSFASLLISLFNQFPITTLRTGITSLLGVSNLYLLSNSVDYFAQPTQLNIFTHTWSLGVEEQFYLIFPFILWYSGFIQHQKESGKRLFLILISLITISLIVFFITFQINQPFAYFLMPTRFWEMAMGSLAFLCFYQKNLLRKIHYFSAPIYLFFIILIMFLPYGGFGLYNFFVVIFTALLILSLNEKTILFRIFNNDNIRYIGKISYSLYLYHWGVIVLSKWTIGIHWWTIPFQVFLIFLLSCLSYEIIEKSFRYKNNFKNTKDIAKFIGLNSLFLSFLVISYKSYDKLFLLDKLVSQKEIHHNKKRDCYNSEIIVDKSKLLNCIVPSNKEKSKKSVFLIGDSHAGYLEEMANIALEKSDSKLYFFANTSDKEFFPFTLFNTDKNKFLRNLILDNVKKDDFVIIHFYKARFNNSNLEHSNNFHKFKKNTKYMNALLNLSSFAKDLDRKGAKLILIEDIPIMKTYTPISICEVQKKLFTWDNCSVPIGMDKESSFFQEKLFRKINNNFSNTYIWDLKKFFFVQDGKYSFADKNGKTIMEDFNHINLEFSRYLAVPFRSFLLERNLL